MMTIEHIIHFSDAGKEIMLNALPYVIDNAHDDKHTYINYVKVCGKMDADTLACIAKLASDEIKSSSTIHVTEQNKLVMSAGLNIYGNRLIDRRKDLAEAGDKETTAHVDATLNNVLQMITDISGMVI